MEMNFWNIFKKECEKRGSTPHGIGKLLKIAPSTIAGWKNGHPPNSEKIKQLADYFNISADILLGRSGSDPDLPEDEKKLLHNYRRADERGRKIIQRIAADEAAGNEEIEEKKELTH